MKLKVQFYNVNKIQNGRQVAHGHQIDAEGKNIPGTDLSINAPKEISDLVGNLDTDKVYVLDIYEAPVVAKPTSPAG